MRWHRLLTLINHQRAHEKRLLKSIPSTLWVDFKNIETRISIFIFSVRAVFPQLVFLLTPSTRQFIHICEVPLLSTFISIPQQTRTELNYYSRSSNTNTNFSIKIEQLRMAGLESMIVDEKPTPVDREKVYNVIVVYTCSRSINESFLFTDVPASSSSILLHRSSSFH